MSRRSAVMLAVLGAIWGASFMFIKVAVREVDPIALVWLRLTLAALVLVPAALLRSGRAAIAEARSAAGRLSVLGVVNCVLPFALISWAETRIDSGLAAILQAAAPLFTVIIATRVGDERVSVSRMVGVVAGFAGVVILVGMHFRGGQLAALAVVAAALLYAAGGVYAGRALRTGDPLVVAAGSLFSAAAISAPFGLATLPGAVPGWKETASVLVLGVAGTGIAYMLYFAIMRDAGPSRSILVTYIVPFVALVYGVLLLGEPLRTIAVFGLLLIVGGVGFSAGRPRALRPARNLTR